MSAMQKRIIRLCCFQAMVAAVAQFSAATAADLDIFPGDSFENAVENLNAGDTLTVHAGTYIDSGRISVQVSATAAAPVIIQSAAGEPRPWITRSAGDQPQNTINVEGAEYLTIRGLEISSNGGDGINLNSNPSFITLEDLVIHDIDVGINFRSSMHHITARRNHIYNTNGTREGFYVGSQEGDCAVTDSLIEENWIHDTLQADQGDGIEVKKGSHSNVIPNNVIHDTNYPCLLFYGTQGNPRNVVEGNVMWNCGAAGIQAAADTIFRNNIILHSIEAGFLSQSHNGVTPENLEFVHNTLVGGDPCVRLDAWNDKQGLVFANNAIYCPADSFRISGLNGVTVAGNVFEPEASGFPAGGYTVGRSENLDFLDADNLQVYPTSDSAVLGVGDPAYSASTDFNVTARLGGVDAGAYAWTGASNPGWTVGPGFKGSQLAPSLSFSANPTTVPFQGSATLNWSAVQVASCDASGDWSGPRAVTGNEDTGPLEQDSSFTLRCLDNGSNPVTQTVSVTVGIAAPAPTLNLGAEPTSVAFNSTAMLSWSTTDADDCQASGAWSGPKDTNGDESVGPLTAESSFTLDCTGAGGTVRQTVSVSVQAENPDDGGGAALQNGGALWDRYC